MANPAARQGQDADGNTLLSQPGSAVAPSSGAARRGSADSFRELLARLKKSGEQVQEDLIQQTEAPAPAPAAEMAAPPQPVEALPPVAIVIKPNPALLPPEAVAETAVEPPVALEPPVPPPPDARELERRARMRAEAHAASKEIIARLRKAAGQPADKKDAAQPHAEAAVVEAPAVEQSPPPVVEEALLVEAAEPAQPIMAEPAEVAAAPAAQDPVQEPLAGRRRHPFFPDVFLDDGEEAELAPPPVEAEPAALQVVETSEAVPDIEVQSGIVEEAFEPAADEASVQDIAADIAAILEAPPVALEPPPPPSAPEAEEQLAPFVPEAIEAAPPEPEALLQTTEAPADEADDDQGHQEELIEDEADAVRHLRGVEVKGIGDIAKAVFSAPTPAERAEFLAALKQADIAEIQPAEVMAADAATLAGTAVSVRKIAPADDPFAKIAPDVSAHVNHEQPDDDSGELARSLLDMMLSSPSAGLPQERALAADALLKLIPKVPSKALIAIAERLSLMDSPPNLLIAKLINDPRIEISGPLLEQCNHISDQVLGKVVATGQISLQRLIARRRHLSAALTDQLIEFDDASVLLTLVRNSGAVISHAAFDKLMQHAKQHSDTLAPLATRSDLPPTVAFELFWFVPAELRRYLLSRFLTDSETLTKILKITKVMQGGEGSESQFADNSAVEEFIAALTQGRREDAIQMLATMSGISVECASRIVGDRQGEPLAIVFKAIGLTRAQFEDYVAKLQQPDVGIISAERIVLELQSTFNSMSFNKARILLTYWDWAVLKHGPYAEAQ